MKKTVSLLITVVLLSLFLGCSKGDQAEVTPIDLVPEKSNMIGYLDLARILEDEDFAGFYQAIQKEDAEVPSTLDEALAMLGGDLEEALLFGDISDMSGGGSISDLAEGGELPDVSATEGYFGIIVKGTFEEDGLISTIASATGEYLETIAYNDHTLYTDSSEESAIAFLGKDAFIIGSMQSVEDVISVWEGEQSAISGKLLDNYNNLGDVLFKLAIVLPPDLIEESLPESSGEEMPIDLSVFGDIEVIALTMDKQGESLPFALELCFSNSESAEDVKGTLSFFTGLLSAEGMGEVPEEAQALLESLDIILSDSCVEITLELTTSMLDDLTGDLGEIGL